VHDGLGVRSISILLFNGFPIHPVTAGKFGYLYPMICFPNGKINLGLYVLSERADGFHNIETVLYPVPVRDVLEFLPAKTFQFTISGFPIDGIKEENIVYKAWLLLHKNFKLPPLGVHLHKAIPPGSGLGGGSSDAAFFIQEANNCFHLEIGKKEMINLTAQLGSDCPFFIENKPSLATGKGEILQEININLKGKYLLLIKSGIHISTAQAYSMVKAEQSKTRLTEIVSKPLEQWTGLLKNDFEETVFEAHPELEEIKNNLYHLGADYASMTGSGSAVFGIFNKQPVLKNINPKYYLWSGKL
jgi:4-diphosphocytidyl-2-C-methyl-D-erythritol kinase